MKDLWKFAISLWKDIFKSCNKNSAMSEEQKMKKQPILTPKLLEKTEDSYKAVERLMQNLDTEGVCNIGVTGPYGSGKSSVIKTLIAHDGNKHKFLELSLATLDDEGAEKDEKKIEANLLKQMVYREKHDTLSNSRFRRVQFHSIWSLIWKPLFVIAVIIAFAIAYEPKILKIDNIYDFFNLGSKNIWWDCSAVVVLLIALFFFVRYVIKTYGRSKLRKLNISDGEIEIGEEDSVFSEHLAEILYFFQETEYNVVVFEDLDRFQNKKIFLKLRELNYILNKSKELGGRKIKFVYAVKDDMFDDASRTKFFDYIVPIIPVMNMWNARDLLKKELKDRGYDEKEISDDDMKVIAFFIDDMRILINIANEYEQYRERLDPEGTKLEAKKLLSAIVYKNYHPDDFSDLHNQKGNIYDCINKKEDFAKYAINKVLADREKNIEVRERNLHLSLKELRMVYMSYYTKQYQLQNSTIRIDGVFKAPQAFVDDENLFNKLTTIKRLTHKPYGGYENTRDVDFSEVETLVSQDSYSDRVTAITYVGKDIKKERRELEKEKSRIRSYSLKDLIVKFNLNDEPIYERIGLSPMADLFLRRGLIAEDYYDYMSYFYDGMITNSDRELLLEMNRNAKLDFDRHIDKVENFFKELPSFVYNTDAILNKDLVDYVAKTNIRNNNEFNLIIDKIKRPEGRLDFLLFYYENGQYPDRVCKAYLKDYAENAWREMLTTVLVSDEQRVTLIESWFKYCNQDDIKDEQVEWLNEHYSFLSSREANITNLDVIFEKCTFVELDNNSDKLLQMAIDNDSYTITADNLCHIYRFLAGIIAIQPSEITYGKLVGTNNAELIRFLDDNINETIKVCTNPLKDEEEDIIVKLLNNEGIEDEVLSGYLKGQVNFVSNLEAVIDKRIGLAIDCDVVKMIWPNVLHYYNINGLDERLTKFIIRYSTGLSENKCEGDGDSSLQNEIVAKKEIPLAEFKLLMGSFKYYVNLDDSVDWEKYDRDKLYALIDDGFIEYSVENRAVLGSTSAYANYLTYYKDKFMQELDKVSLGTTDVKDLFLRKEYTLDEKFQIVDAIEDDVIDSELSDTIINMLRQKKVDVEGSKLKLMCENATTIDNKVFAATLYIGKNIGNRSRIEAVLNEMPSPYSVILTSAHPKFDKNVDNEALLRVLETGGYISAKPYEKDGKEYLRTYMIS